MAANTSLVPGAGSDHTTVGRPFLDGPSDYLLAGLVALAGAGMVGTWLVGQTAALITGGGWAPVSITDGFTALTRLPRHLSDPAAAWPLAARSHLPGPVGFVVAAVLDLLLVVAATVWAVSRRGRTRRRRGFASPAQVADVFSPDAVNATAARLTAPEPGSGTGAGTRAKALRPARSRPGAPPPTSRSASGADAGGVDAGRTDPLVHGAAEPVRIGIENSVLVLAAPRQGKTSQVVIPWVTGWAGPALVTSVRPAVVLATAGLRPGIARVLDLTGTAWPERLQWSPVAGCQEFDVARRRADLLVTVGKTTAPGASDSTNSAFFGTSATNLLAGWLHTAALTGRSLRDVLTWAMNESDDTALKALRDAKTPAAPGVASMLSALYSTPGETRSSLFATVLTGIAPLLSRTAQDAFCPTGPGFDPAEFVAGTDTVYLIVPDTHTRDLAPLVACLVDEIVRAATARAALAPRGRLNPALGLFLDEVANVAPLPSLPQLMSYAAGSGIFVTAVLQDLAQARARWGRDGADMLWGAATCKLVLGGLTGDEPETISKLAGTYRETVTTTSRMPTGATTSSSLQDRAILSPEAIRTLDPGLRQGLLLHATTPPVITRMVRHYEGPRANDHAACEAGLRAAIGGTP